MGATDLACRLGLTPNQLSDLWQVISPDYQGFCYLQNAEDIL